MKRTELEKHLGENVEITIFDGKTIKGELHKTGEERFKNDANLFLPRNLYFLVPQTFLLRCSHVKKLIKLN